MNIYLDELQKMMNTQDIVEFVRDIYESSEDIYIPALINEGDFIGELKADFYVKLILKHKDISIKKTWLINNLQFALPTPFDIDKLDKENIEEIFIHNIIVYKNYRNSNIYQINPLLTATELYQEEGVKNLKYVEAYYEDEYQSKKGNLILDYLKKGNNEYFNVLKNFLTEYVIYEGQRWDSAYELVAEFEYRNKNHSSLINNYIDSTSGMIDYYHNDKQGLYLRGSIKVPFNYSESKVRSIKVIDLRTNQIRSHNPKHYNGDVEEGFVVFSKKAMEILKEEYFFYDIEMIEKKYIDNRVLVDYLGDRVVFWEAEYNKLPTQLKDRIDKYNIVPDDEKIISKAMYTMQLEVSWHWDKELVPDKKLAYIIKTKMFERAIDMDLNFIYPQSSKDLQKFIRQIETLTQIKLEKFNAKSKEVSLLIAIRDSKEVRYDSEKYLEELYLKYCFAIGEVLGGVN